jgi:hypothetical protein
VDTRCSFARAQIGDAKRERPRRLIGVPFSEFIFLLVFVLLIIVCSFPCIWDERTCILHDCFLGFWSVHQRWRLSSIA